MTPNSSNPVLPTIQPQPTGRVVSSAELELQNFAFGLGSYSVAPETDKAEQGTRQEAELLMSLCSSPVHMNKADIEAISATESDFSYHSDSSGSRRDNFTFVCPSFSLDNSEVALRRIKHNDKVRRSTNSTTDPNNNGKQVEGDMPAPALLLKRSLKVDDRDAYRLSTEAMARNLSRSMQKALEWRMETWIHSLSLSLVKQEKEMQKEGASEPEIRTLVGTSEAMLLVQLQALKSQLQVTGAGTTFRVLEEKAEIETQPIVKKRRFSNDGMEAPQHMYTATHELVVDGVVNLETPMGHSEILLEIPGTMSGTFVSYADQRDVLESVNLDVQTEFLAAMIEKASRKLVRESVSFMLEQQQDQAKEAEATVSTTEYKESKQQDIHQTPSPALTATPLAPLDVRAAIITPGAKNPTGASEEQPVKFLLPIPDDLNDSTPSRISPQPKSPTMEPASTMHLPPQTPKPNAFSGASVLVSPTVKEPTDFHEVPENSPSLPLLVEVACRQFRSD